MNMFSDDAEIQRKCQIRIYVLLQYNLPKLHEWSHVANGINCRKMSCNEIWKEQCETRLSLQIRGKSVQVSDMGNDLGVFINGRLSPDHIYKRARNMYIAGKYVNEESIKEIITSIIRPSLEYEAVVWNPHLKNILSKLKRQIERPQKGFQAGESSSAKKDFKSYNYRHQKREREEVI